MTGGIEDIKERDFIVNDTLLAVRICSDISDMKKVMVEEEREADLRL